MRNFYEWAGGTARDHEALAWFASATPEQMGPERARFRGGIVGRMWATAALLGLAAGLTVGVLVLVVGPGDSPGVAVVGFLLALLLVLVVMCAVHVAARRYRYDVHAHGLVLRGLRGLDDVIPWATVDPGRIFVARSIRAMTCMPIALHRQRAVFPPGVVVNGWTNRPVGDLPAFEAFSSGYRYQPTASDSPFGWWQLGVTDPEGLLWAIEQAMVADRYPARGLAHAALSTAREKSTHRERLLDDRVIGSEAAD